MTARRPLVVDAGNLAELGATDTVALASLSVGDGDTSPDPGAPSWAWSSTLSAPVYWDGVAWRAVSGGLSRGSILALVSSPPAM